MEAFREALNECRLINVRERSNLPETNIRERFDKG